MQTEIKNDTQNAKLKKKMQTEICNDMQDKNKTK